MRESLHLLSPNELRSIAGAFRTGRIGIPCIPSSLARFVSEPILDQVLGALKEMAAVRYSAAGIAHALDLLADSRSSIPKLDDVVQLVMSGPHTAGFERRDTSVVVSELFRNARESVLIAGYAVYQGRRVFSELAKRMDDLPDLEVRMFLDISPKPGDPSIPSAIVQQFVRRFRSEEWPSTSRLPQVFYDPRALSPDWRERASMHAKCVVADSRLVFVSSANFTEAAQERNFEIGVLFESDAAGERINRIFAALVRDDQFRPVA